MGRDFETSPGNRPDISRCEKSAPEVGEDVRLVSSRSRLREMNYGDRAWDIITCRITGWMVTKGYLALAWKGTKRPFKEYLDTFDVASLAQSVENSLREGIGIHLGGFRKAP